jgi:hypothetical protein
MKLRQGQVYKLDNQYIRIVVLERLAVEYKSMQSLRAKEGQHVRTTKKEFCKLIKPAVLFPTTPQDILPEAAEEYLGTDYPVKPETSDPSPEAPSQSSSPAGK